MKNLNTLALLAVLFSFSPIALADAPEKELARIWLDLDGDKVADRVTIVDSGVRGANYVLRVKLDERARIIEAKNVITSPQQESLWSVDPQYKLEKAGRGSFILQMRAGDYDAYRGIETFRFALALKNGELVVLSYLTVSDHVSTGDPDRLLSLNYRFLDGKILGKIDSHHRDQHNRQGASEPLQRRCRGPQPLSSWENTLAVPCARDSALRLEKRLDELTQN